mgnify:CR=1 FL=1
MLKNVFIGLATALLFVSQCAVAHQQKTSISKVLFNQRTSNIEIMHRFRVHDAEHAVKHIFGKDAEKTVGSELKSLKITL